MHRLLQGLTRIYHRPLACTLPVFGLLIDQIVKAVVVQIGDYIINDLWFGILVSSWLLFVTTLIFLFVVAAAWVRSGYCFSVGLILVGGTSNLIDRLHHGGVIDYLFIGSFVFNISDVLIWIGCLLVLFYHGKKGSKIIS